MNPGLSVVIVAYKPGNEIIDCLSSVSKFVKVPYEILIADNSPKEPEILEKLPDFSVGTPPDKIVRGIEEFCSIEPGKALSLYSPTSITFRPDFLKIPASPEFECLLRAMTAIDLEKHGLEFVIIGNEAVAQEEQK